MGMTNFFRNFPSEGLTALRMKLCAAKGCPSFSTRLTSVKTAPGLIFFLNGWILSVQYVIRNPAVSTVYSVYCVNCVCSETTYRLVFSPQSQSVQMISFLAPRTWWLCCIIPIYWLYW